MNYFKHIGQEIQKYKVTFEEAKIKKLRAKIIEECSLIFYKEKFSADEPIISGKLKNKREIRNCVKGEKVTTYESTENDISIKIYHYRYEEYQYPYLIELIDRLLSGDDTTLNEIFNPNLEKENIPFEKIIELAESEMQKMQEEKSNNNTSHQLRNKLIELNYLKKALEINKKQKPVIDYYQELQKLITLELIEIISLEESEKKALSKTSLNNNVHKRVLTNPEKN